MNSDLAAVSNNPLVWEHAGEACRRVEGSALDVLYECLRLVGNGAHALHTHPVAGNARLLHNPFRTVFVRAGAPSPEQMMHDLRCLELFIGKMEDLGGEAPAETFDDYRTVDYGLYLGMLPEDAGRGCLSPKGGAASAGPTGS